MFDCITFDEYGRMYLIYDGIESMREEFYLGDALCAVFKADPDFDLDRLPDAERIRKCVRLPKVHVFVGIEEKGAKKKYIGDLGAEGSHFSHKVFGRKVSKLIWDKVHDLLDGVV